MSTIVRIDDDGTRHYASRKSYRPVPLAERKIGVNRPDDPRAVRFGAKWFLPLELLPEKDRITPETEPDSTAYEHMSVSLTCRCGPCTRPQAARWRRKWRKDQAGRSQP